MKYAAFHLDAAGFKTWPALLYLMGETEPKKPGDIVTDHTGNRYIIDFCMEEPNK